MQARSVTAEATTHFEVEYGWVRAPAVLLKR
jgi:hypothetical protein